MQKMLVLGGRPYLTTRTYLDGRPIPLNFPPQLPGKPGHKPPFIELPPGLPKMDGDDYRQVFRGWRSGPVLKEQFTLHITGGICGQTPVSDLLLNKLFFDAPRVQAYPNTVFIIPAPTRSVWSLFDRLDPQ